MAVFPDLGAAMLYAAVVFLVALGILVVFVETVSPRRAASIVAAAIVVAAAFSFVSEIGLAFIALGLASAVVANSVFEWLTTR